MQFDFPALPYAYDALEPVIDAATMEIHYGKHHRGYTDNLNKLVVESDVMEDIVIEDLLANISDYSAGIRNNAGGYYNHNFFWTSMKPGGSEMSADLAERITQQFGSIEAMQEQFAQSAATRFGSGWAWLGVRSNGEFKVYSTANQDNPLMNVVIEQEGQYAPVLALDVWEHAYYLNYQNRRAEYIANWWGVVDWSVVEQRTRQATGE